MKLYQITLPTHDNAGAEYQVAHADWRARAIEVAGGYTHCGDVYGDWREPSTGEVFHDRSRLYQVACEPDQWAELVAYTKRLFADQICLAVATLGDFELV